MTTNGIERAIGQLQATTEHLQSSVDSLDAQVQVLNAHMENQKGSRRMLFSVGGVAGVIAGVIGGIIGKSFPP